VGRMLDMLYSSGFVKPVHYNHTPSSTP